MHKKKKELLELQHLCLANGSTYAHDYDLNRGHVHERASFHHARGHVHAYRESDSTLFLHLLFVFWMLQTCKINYAIQL